VVGGILAVMNPSVADTERRDLKHEATDGVNGSRELVEGLEEGDEIKVRDAAEKLWNAVVSAANALVLHYTGVVPASHWERRRMLEKLEDTIPEVEKLGLRDRYGARERYLHMMTFYDGIIDEEMLRREVVKAKRYVEDVEKLIELGRGLGV